MHNTDSSPAATANAALDSQGRLSLTVGDWSLQLTASNCTEFVDTVQHCDGGATVAIRGPQGIAQSLQVDTIYVNSAATAYRGSLAQEYQQHGYTFVLGDLNGDGHDDLMIATGREGGYGGRSYDVFLFEPKSTTFVRSEAMTELMKGANAPFSVNADGSLALSFTDGCCLHVFETYQMQGGNAVLVERVSEDSTDSKKPVTKIERLVDGKLQEVSSP